MPHLTTNILIDLASNGFLIVSGVDAKKLLQGQLTCDLEKITPTKSALGALCNPQGRVISLFRLFMIGSDYYLQMPKDLLLTTSKALQKYAVFYKVTLTISPTLQTIGLSGSNLLTNLPFLPKNSDEVMHQDDITIIRLPGNLIRYEMIGEPSSIKKQWGNLLKLTQPAPENTWKHCNIRTGIPSIYSETSEKFLPHEIQLDKLNAISFEKGCYTGQEIIARMHYLGKLKNRLYRARVQSSHTPQYGDPIYAEQARGGYIVDYCQIDPTTLELLVITQESPSPLFLEAEKINALEILNYE